MLVQGTQTLLGVVSKGDSNGAGAVFELARNGGVWNETTFYAFCHYGYPCADGDSPNNQLLVDPAGNLYGITSNGGSEFNAGVVYKITPTGNETVLYTFCANGDACADGAIPFGLSMDSSGNLFGTTASGGNQWQGGVAFELERFPAGLNRDSHWMPEGRVLASDSACGGRHGQSVFIGFART
ncbi:MAG: choice-of-anchor tandem repeat GloVer-containing protein, partial [Rhizomicrobium sp.]